MKLNGLKPVIQKRDEAVSPIIATILLVAITVILASTLYLALGGFFSHTSTAAPTASISATNTTTSAGTYTYTIGIGSISSATIPWSSTEWAITINGTVYTVSWTSGSSDWKTLSPTTGPTSVTVSSPSGTYVTGATLSLTITYATVAPGPITTLAFTDTGTNGGQMGTASL